MLSWARGINRDCPRSGWCKYARVLCQATRARVCRRVVSAFGASGDVYVRAIRRTNVGASEKVADRSRAQLWPRRVGTAVGRVGGEGRARRGRVSDRTRRPNALRMPRESSRRWRAV